MAKTKDADSDSGVKLIIEKYLAKREDIVDPIRKVLITLYKGKVNTASEWENIIKRRLERPA
jgi:chloramphenicol 3-O-phosphotransferase